MGTNACSTVMLEGEDYDLKVSITLYLRGAALAASLYKRLLGVVIIHHIGPHSYNPAGFPLG